MPLVKLEGLTQPIGNLGKGIVTGVTTGVKGAATGATSGATAGLTGVFSLGRGFRDFILRGNVVELAVAVVLGTAFTELISSATKNFITPLIAAIFAGSNFSELSFYINGSRFNYGDFINAFLTFLFVLAVLYFCVVVPVEKLQFAAFKHRAIRRDCPFCLEEISMAASRCKHCCGEVPLDAEMQRTLAVAQAALDAEEERRQQKWYRRWFAPCSKCSTCCQPKTAVVAQAADGEVQLQPVDLESAGEVVAVSPLRQSMSSGGMQQRASSTTGQPGSVFVSPHQSFTSAGSDGAATAIEIQQLVQEQPKTK